MGTRRKLHGGKRDPNEVELTRRVPGDTDRLNSVLELAKTHGLRLHAVVVGDVKLVLSSPWPEPEAPAKVDQSKLTAEEREVLELRALSRKTFGHNLPDEMLAEYRKDGLL